MGRYWPVPVLVCGGPLFYHRMLTPGWAAVDYDLVTYFEPYRAYLAAAWTRGRLLPLWNPDIFLGAPLLANIQAAVLYPPNLLLAVLPASVAISWLIAIHLGIAGAGMYLYGLVCLRLRVPGSLVCALVYALGALMVSQAGHLNQSNTLAWTPWLMLAADRAARRPRPPRLAAVAVLVALVILAGHTQQAYFTFVLATIAAGGPLWQMTVRQRRWSALRAVPLLAAAVALGAGIAALQLAATAELVGQSIRSGGLALDQAGSFSLPFRGVAGDLLPDYTAEHRAEFASSVGAASLALIALALATRWKRPRVGLWAVLGIVALAAAFGPRGGVYIALFHAMPGLSLFRVPARLLVFTTVAAAVLAGHGTLVAQQLASAWRRGRRGGVARALGGAGALTATPLLAVLAAARFGEAQRGIWAAFPQPVQRDNLALLAAFPALVLLVTLVGLGVRGRVAWALPAVVAADLTLLAGHTYPLNPLPERLDQSPGTTSSLTPATQDQRSLSLVPTDNQLAVDSELPPGLTAQDQDRYRSYLRLIDSQAPDVSMGSGPPDADGYDGGLLPIRSYVSYRAAVLPPRSGNRPDYTIRLLTDRAWSCGWLESSAVGVVISVAGTDPNPPGSHCLAPSGSAGGLVAWRPVTYRAARARMESGTAARIVRETGEEVVVDLPPGASGRLILSDTYYPGWTATADGRPATIDRYDGYLRSVPVRDGTRRVEFEYRPRWLAPGLLVSLLSALVALALAMSPALLPALARAARRPRPSSA